MAETESQIAIRRTNQGLRTLMRQYEEVWPPSRLLPEDPAETVRTLSDIMNQSHQLRNAIIQQIYTSIEQ